MTNESKTLAEKIYEIDNAKWEIRKEWSKDNKQSWALIDDIYMTVSGDFMCWYLWKKESWKRRRKGKIVPRHVDLTKEQIAAILDNQTWFAI